MSNTVTIVIDGGLVQSVYATDSTMRVIVLDLDIEGSDPDDPRISMDHAAVQEHVIESYQAMPHEERKTLEKFLLSRELILKPYSVLLLYPDTGNDPETYYAHTEAENPDAAIANAGQKPRPPICEWRQRISYP